jgi:hypothetical protein
MNERKVKPRAVSEPNSDSEGEYIKAKSFQAVTFHDELQKRQIIVLYTLGEDGIVREYNGSAWKPYPIEN